MHKTKFSRLVKISFYSITVLSKNLAYYLLPLFASKVNLGLNVASNVSQQHFIDAILNVIYCACSNLYRMKLSQISNFHNFCGFIFANPPLILPYSL